MGRLIFINKKSPFGFRNREKKKKIAPLSRDERIVLMRKKGQTFQSIADEFGISCARVQQIVKKHGRED